MQPKQLHYKISPEIFEKFPGFNRLVLIVSVNGKLDLPPTNFSELPVELNLESLSQTPAVASWRKAFRAMDIDPTKERVSFEALTRRLLNAGTLRNINALVDLGNQLSIKYQCPIGIHPLESLTEDICLKLAAGNETYEPFDSDEIQRPLPREIILVSGLTVLTRRMCWRQSKRSAVNADTDRFFINIDFLDVVNDELKNEIVSSFAHGLAGLYRDVDTLRFELNEIRNTTALY